MKAALKLEILVLITLLTPFLTPTKKLFVAKAGRVRRSPDILCNVGSRFECVCHAEDGDLVATSNYKLCYNFISSGTLPALRLILSQFGTLDVLRPDTTVPLSDGTAVTYEYYFRFHLAKILTRYCVEDASRCKNVGFAVKPESVIILQIIPGIENHLVVDYSVATSFDVKELTSDTVVHPSIILKAVDSELQNVVQPYPIDKHEPHFIVVPDSGQGSNAWRDNIGLIIALIVFACILVFIYIIAIIKAVRYVSLLKEENRSHDLIESCYT